MRDSWRGMLAGATEERLALAASRMPDENTSASEERCHRPVGKL